MKVTLLDKYPAVLHLGPAGLCVQKQALSPHGISALYKANIAGCNQQLCVPVVGGLFRCHGHILPRHLHLAGCRQYIGCGIVVHLVSPDKHPLCRRALRCRGSSCKDHDQGR